MVKSRVTGLVLVAAGLLLVTASFREFIAETAPYVAGGVSQQQRLKSLENGTLVPAKSQWSKDLFFYDCIYALTDPLLMLTQKTAEHVRSTTHCRDEAGRVLASEPYYAMGWLVTALASAELRDFDAMRTAVHQSWRTSAHVEWMAEQRVALIDKHATETDTAELIAGYRSDAGTLLSSREGTNFIANVYVAKPDRRELITEVAEGVTPELQADFLARVRAVTAGRTSR